MTTSLLAGFAASATADDAYRAGVDAFRQKREASLKADESWLTLAGLHWLKPGATRVGGDPASEAKLPATAPARVGVLEVEGDRVRFRSEPGVSVTRDGKPFPDGELTTDAKGHKPDVLAVGAIRLIVIRRGERYALRVKDNLSPVRANFTGLNWFPVDETWRIKARFEPSARPSSMVMETVVGTREEVSCPGVAVFERDGKEYRLDAAREGDSLWFVFRDATAGRTTSANARQLNTDPPGPDGFITLDFNRAVNLPCAYTPHATCPLAPKRNRLTLPIPAGERLYEPPTSVGDAARP